MPARPAVMQLPEDVRAWLDGELIKRGFAGYEELAQLLAEKGYQLSKSALHRYGQRFEERAQALKLATDQARALVESAPDDEGALSDALIRLVQEKLFSILMDLDVEQIDKINVASLTKGIATLARATVKQKEWQTEVRGRAQAVADEVTKTAREAGMSAETATLWRQKILGIAG